MLVSKQFNKNLIKIFFFMLILIVLGYSIAINSFKNGKFTCNKYLLNTYLYIVLTFNLLIIMNLTLEYNNINIPLSLGLLFMLFIINIICIVLLNYLDSERVILKHLIWLLFVFIMGLIVYPMYITSEKKVVTSAFITTLLITLVLSAVAYAKPEWISLSMGPILFFALVYRSFSIIGD